MTDLNYRKKSLTETFSSSSTDSSHEEEERLKLLFMSCDSNNDGRLDKKDLITMCQKLNMLELAEEIISALGASSNGSSISFQEFLRCRAKVLRFSETDSPYKKSPEYLVHSNYYSQPINPPYDHLGGSCSDISQIYSSVDYDSGTQEIQEEPLSLFAMLHQCYGELYCQWTAAERENTTPSLSQQLLQCANQIHLTRINRVYSELKMAVKRLNSCHVSRDNYQKEITRHQKERERLKLELQNQTSRYEDRLTELHSVIAELQKKNERKERNTIIEEDEEMTNDENDNANNADYEKLNLNLGDSVKGAKTGTALLHLSCSTSFVDSNICGIEKSIFRMQKIPVCILLPMVSDKPGLGMNFAEVQTDITSCFESQIANIQKNDRTTEKLQEATEKQLRVFQQNHIYLQEKLSGYENAVSNLRTQLANVLEERESLRKQLKDLQECIDVSNTPAYSQQSSSCSVSKISIDSKSTNSSSSSPARPIMGVRQQQSKQNQIKPVGSDTEWVQKVVNKYQKSLISPTQNILLNNMIDDSNSILTSGLVFLQELSENVPYPALVEPCKRISLEWQRLVANSDRESADKLLLQTTLAENKSISDQLQCSIGQLQSDCAALTRSNLLADQIIELADILIQLQETDPLGSGVDVTNQSLFHEPAYQNNSMILTTDTTQHRSTGSCGDIGQLRHGYREQVESAAKLFIYRLECYSSMGRQTPDSGAGVSSTLSSGGGSVDVESVMRQASSTGDWSKADELKLKRLLDQLITERSRARLSVVGMHLGQSFYGQCLSSSNQSSLHRLDLGKLASNDFENQTSVFNQQLIENAILLQELCSLKEEKATLKTRIYLLEKEVKSIQLALESKSACEKSLKVQLNQMVQHRADFISGTDESKKLKTQIEDLLQALDELRERCQVQQHQNDEFVNDLKKANAALISAFEKAKKKYQNKISRLETQLSSSSCQPNSASDETAL